MALERLGRPRSRRTVEYVKRRLIEMGLIRCAHVKRSGPRRVPGQLDTCRIWLRRGWRKRLRINCTPPLWGTGKRSFVAELPCAAPAESESRRPDRPHPPPQQPADPPPREEAATPLSAEEDMQRQLDFDALKREMGWNVPKRWRAPR